MENVVFWPSTEALHSSATAQTESFPDVFIRGNHVCYIAPYATDAPSQQGEDESSSSDESSDMARNAIANERAMI